MPQLFFPSGSLASISEADIDTIKLTKNLGRPAQFATRSVASIGRLSRLRSFPGLHARPSSQLRGVLKRRVSFGGGTIATRSRSAVKFFLNAAPVAPPVGGLQLQRIESLTDPKHVGPRLNGSRLIKEDLIPVYFIVRGEKTAGLTARFEAKQLGVLDGMTPLTIEKAAPANIKQTSAVIDPQTTVEKLTGNFSIEPGDTAAFPEGEVEMAYRFWLTDGLGRNYTIERGSFTVFTAL